MTHPISPICRGCVHLHDQRQVGIRCDAFPDGIPTPILTNERDHREPYRGDHGIQFDPRTPADATYADSLFPRANAVR